MATFPDRLFDCQLYVPARRPMMFRLPSETGPMRVIRLEPMPHEELITPEFRRLLAAFESLPQPLAVQVYDRLG